MIEENETQEQVQLNTEKHAQFSKFLQEQEKVREELKSTKLEKAQEFKDPKESVDYIIKVFEPIATRIGEEVKGLSELKVVQREQVNQLWDSLHDLREFFSQTSFALALYDQKQFKLALKKLEAEISDLQLKVPRQKFKFKRKAAKKEVDDSDLFTISKENQEDLVNSIKGLSNLSGVTLKITQDELEDNYKLVDITDCTIEFTGVIRMLWMKNITNSVIKAPISCNSIMLHNARDCKFQLASQQIRLHTSQDCSFRVFTTSKLIIEDCTKLKFSEWAINSELSIGETLLFDQAGFKSSNKNYWSQVQDFNWIKQEKSPNFEIVQE